MIDAHAADVGDPGAYRPNEKNELAAISKASFGRSGSSGHSGFGSAAARGIPLQIMGEDTPGPSDYNPEKTKARPALSSAEGRSSASSAFRSTSAQRLPPPHSAYPGPAAYDVGYAQVAPVMGNPVTSKAGRDSRFVGDFITNVGSENPVQVGPGHVDSHRAKTIAHDLARSVDQMGHIQGAFGVRQAAHLLPPENWMVPIPHRHSKDVQASNHLACHLH